MIKTAFRNLARHKGISLINICGLGVGIAAALIIFIVVKHELSYDRFQKNYHHIYHLVTENKFADDITYNPGISIPALDALRADMPDITFAGLFSSYGSQVTVENTANLATDKKFIEDKGVFFCEPQFFKVFSYSWLAGNANVLNEPNEVVLTKSIAEKYFGSWQKAIGKVISMDNVITLGVAGIIHNPPANTDFPLRVLASYATLKNDPTLHGLYDYSADWGSTSSNFQVYMLLPPHVTAQYVDQQLLQFSKSHWRKHHVDKETIFLQPLSRLHFDARFPASFGDHVTSMRTLWTLSIIGVFILLMACINFINLSTAQAVSRSKEMGVRKVLGGSRWQLFRQVMSETVIIVLLAVILALILTRLGMPFVKGMVSIEKPLSLWQLPVLTFLLILLLGLTLLSGFYPALMMSGYDPIIALRSKAASVKVGGVSLRRSLIIIQFAISQALIVCTIVIISQMEFIRHTKMGFDTAAVLILNNSTDSSALARQGAFKQALLQIPGVRSVSFNSDAPSSDNSWSSNFSYDHGPELPNHLFLKFADTGYFKTYGIHFLAGKVYEPSDTINQVVINATLMHNLGVTDPDNIIDKQIKIGGGPWHTITGVVEDFHTSSLKTPIQPLLITTKKGAYGNTAIKLRTNNIPKTQEAIQAAWNKFFPEYAYSANFMDQNIADFYKQDRQLSLLYKIFAALAVFISCLGLFGLVSLMAAQKTKEIGIRKVLGASVGQIVYMFSREFMLLVIVAFAVAAPVAYYLMHQWLNNFAYHTALSWWIFALAILLAGLIAIVTIGIKAMRAAIANPVEALRSE